MRIRYTKPDGDSVMYELGEKPLTVGRSPEADIVVYDERVSRVHCGIRLWDGEFYLKDLKSKNGTFLNDHQVEVSKVRGGDIIRVGSSLLMLEGEEQIGANTAIRQIGGEMDMGKGYSTILRQIVSDVPGVRSGPSAPVAPVASSAPVAPSVEGSKSSNDMSDSRKLGTGPIKIGARRPVRITIRRNDPDGK